MRQATKRSLERNAHPSHTWRTPVVAGPAHHTAPTMSPAATNGRSVNGRAHSSTLSARSPTLRNGLACSLSTSCALVAALWWQGE